MIRWITEKLGTAPFADSEIKEAYVVLDVRSLLDKSGNSKHSILDKIDRGVEYLTQGEQLVVCCDYGISRSNTIAAAILAQFESISFAEGLQKVVKETGEDGIKIDFADDVRRALGKSVSPDSKNRALVLGVDGYVGRSVSGMMDSHAFSLGAEEDACAIGNPVLLDAILEQNEADRILMCWHPPRLDTNSSAGKLITALRNVLEVCRVRNIGLTFLSGQQVFSASQEDVGIYDELAVPQPGGADGDALCLAEVLIAWYGKRHSIPTLIIRVPKVYGPGDERPGIVNTFARLAIAGKPIATHRYQNGVPKIDLLHVGDLARALQLTLENNLNGVLHLNSERLVSTDELARLVINIAASSSQTSYVELPSRHRSVQLVSRVAYDQLGWRPRIDLNAGLAELIDYVRTE
jgi:UDP-glucuronate decarboxylase